MWLYLIWFANWRLPIKGLIDDNDNSFDNNNDDDGKDGESLEWCYNQFDLGETILKFFISHVFIISTDLRVTDWTIFTTDIPNISPSFFPQCRTVVVGLSRGNIFFWFSLEYFHKPILTTIDSKTEWQLQPNLKTFHKVCLHSFFYQCETHDDDDSVINSNMYRWRHFLKF